MEMDRQQEKLNEQIRKAKEQLKKLEEKDANLKKRIKEKREKELATWTAKFDKSIQPLIERMFGANYFENVLPEEAVQHFTFLSEFYDALLPEGDREASESLKETTELPGDNSVMLDRVPAPVDNNRGHGVVGCILDDALEMDYGTSGVFSDQKMEHNIPDDTIEQRMDDGLSDAASRPETGRGTFEEFE